MIAQLGGVLGLGLQKAFDVLLGDLFEGRVVLVSEGEAKGN